MAWRGLPHSGLHSKTVGVNVLHHVILRVAMVTWSTSAKIKTKFTDAPWHQWWFETLEGENVHMHQKQPWNTLKQQQNAMLFMMASVPTNQSSRKEMELATHKECLTTDSHSRLMITKTGMSLVGKQFLQQLLWPLNMGSNCCVCWLSFLILCFIAHFLGVCCTRGRWPSSCRNWFQKGLTAWQRAFLRKIDEPNMCHYWLTQRFGILTVVKRPTSKLLLNYNFDM